LYEYDNIDKLTNAMNKFFNDSEYCNRLGENAKQDMISNYSKDRYYKELIKIYMSVCERK
jgi:glycosyltransferase involved in cell wall biosynthesis